MTITVQVLLISVCYINNLFTDRDNADSSSDSLYKIIYLIACTCIYADLHIIYLYLFNYLMKGLSVITNFALHIIVWLLIIY